MQPLPLLTQRQLQTDHSQSYRSYLIPILDFIIFIDNAFEFAAGLTKPGQLVMQANYRADNNQRGCLGTCLANNTGQRIQVAHKYLLSVRGAFFNQCSGRGWIQAVIL